MNIIDELKASADKADKKRKSEEAKAEAAKKRAENAISKKAKEKAPELAASVLESIKSAAANGQRRLDYVIARHHPGVGSEMWLTANYAANLLSDQGFHAIHYFHHEWCTDGDNGWNEDEFGIAVWGW